MEPCTHIPVSLIEAPPLTPPPISLSPPGWLSNILCVTRGVTLCAIPEFHRDPNRVLLLQHCATNSLCVVSRNGATQQSSKKAGRQAGRQTDRQTCVCVLFVCCVRVCTTSPNN